MADIVALVSAYRAAYKEAQMYETERDRLRSESEVAGTKARRAWSEMERLRGELLKDPEVT